MEQAESHTERQEPREIFVVVLGSGLQKRSGAILPGFDEKSRIIAGLTVVKDTGAKHIVFTGGDIYKIGQGLSEFSSRYSQKESLRGHISEHEVDITTIPATNTVEEIEKVELLHKKYPSAHFIVVSNRFHRVAEKQAKKYGLEFVPAEEKLKERYGENIARKIDEIMASSQYQAITADQIRRTRLLDLPLSEFAYKIADYFRKRNLVLK